MQLFEIINLMHSMLFMQYIQLFLTIYKFNYFYRFFSKNELPLIFSHKKFLAKERKMLKRGLFGSKQQTNLTPLIDLISFRSKLSVNRESLNQKIYNYLLNIPILENKEITKLNKKKEPSDIFRSAAPKYKFDSSIVTFLSSNEVKSPADDAYTVIFCYQFFAWYYLDQKKAEDEINIHNLFKCLLKIISTPIQLVVNSILGEILNYIVNNKSFNFDDEFCNDIVRYFELNLTLESNLFSQFLFILKKLFSLEKYASQALSLLDNLIVQKAPILDVPDNEPLIIALQPHVQSLNPSALHVLALLSTQTTTKPSRLSDSFVLIINAIVLNITSSPPVHVIDKTAINDNILTITEKEIIPHDMECLEFLPDFEFIQTFKEPPFDIFNSKRTISFMSQKTKEICKMIGVCIKSANQVYKSTFGKMFLSHLQITESTKFEAFTELAAAFFTLYKDFGSVELLQDSVLPNLSKTIIFNPHLHVFLDKPLDVAINSFREFTIYLIHLYCPNDVYDFLKQLKTKTLDYSFIFVEMLVRIANHKKWFQPKMIQNKNHFYITLMDISRQLQSMNIKYSNSPSSLNAVIKARNSLMIFISSLLNDPFTVISYISSQTFIHGFFWLIFEPNLTYNVLNTIFKSISQINDEMTSKGTFHHFLNFFVSTINTCKKNYDKDKRYEHLSKSMSRGLIDSLYQKPYFSLNFLPILPAFLNLIQKFPGEEILSDMLIFLNLYAKADPQFELSSYLLRIVYNAIKTVEGENISQHTENMLFSLLRRSVCSQSDVVYFISIPSVLPLLLAVFGYTENNSEKIVKLIHQLCIFSDYNKMMCHNGEVDFILIQYACMKTKENRKVVIQFHGCEFSLVFSDTIFKSYVLPLISMISFIKSENEDAHCLIDHLIHSEDPELCFFVTQLVSKSQAIPKPLFSLGSNFTQFSVEGIHNSDFENNGFTLSFMLNIDRESLKNRDLNFTIFKLRDSNNESFTIYLNQISLFAKYESESVRTTVNVVKSIPGSCWVDVAITVSFTPDAVVISNYLNNKKLPDSELSPFTFNPGEIKMTVGGIEKDDLINKNSSFVFSNFDQDLQSDWRNQQLALIGSIKLIKGILNNDDISKLKRDDVKEVLFDSSIIKEPYCSSVYSKQRSEVVNTGLFGKSITDIVVNVHPAPPAPQSLVDIFVKRRDCCKLSNYFNHLSEFSSNEMKKSFCSYPTMILGLINELFKKDVDCQVDFNQFYINKILGNLFKNPKCLNANLYYSFYDVMKNITYKPLIKPWFDSFILNTWLWSMCDYREYYDIIMHYSHVLIVDYRDMFKENSYFSSLFNQTMLLFALDDEGHPETSIADVPPLLNSTYDEKAILHCQDLFLVFLARIGTINLNEMDVASLLAHVSGWKTKSTLIKLLKMVFDISATLINVEGYENNCIPCIQSLIHLNDVDIITNALLILPEIVKAEKLNYLINTAFHVMKYENKEQIFNRILKHLVHSPLQYIFLSILSLDLKKESATKLSNELDRFVFDRNVNYKNKSFLQPMWFLFPLLLAFHSDESSMEKICRFIIFILSKESKKSFENHCNMIFAFASIIATLSNLNDAKVPLYLIKYLFTTSNKDRSSCIAQNAIFIALFKLVSFKNKSILFDEFKKSDFGEYEQNESINEKLSFNDDDPLSMMKFLGGKDLKSMLNLKFVLELENNKVKSNVTTLLEYAYRLMIKSTTFNESEIKVIKYFSQLTAENGQFETTDKNDSNIDTFTAMSEADEVLDKYREMYQERLNSNFLSGQKEIQSIDTFVQNHQNVTNNEMSEMSCIAEFQMKAEYKCHLDSIPDPNERDEHQKTRNMFDQTLCSFFCPFKVKSIEQTPKKIEKNEFLETLIEHSALLLSFNKIPLPVSFRLNKKFILIFANSKKRSINLSSINYVLQRCQGNGLEFVLSNGKSYLLNFQVDLPQIHKALSGVKLPNCRIFMHNDSMSPSSLQKRWLTDQFSNFDYLLRLNMIAGRSFRDRSIYPIFPSLLSDFDDFSSTKLTFDKFRISEGKGEVKVDFGDDKGIKKSFNEFDFVRADYFFRPESIDYVPKWAKDEFEVVHKLRILLESPEVTNNLHKWINNVFRKYSTRFMNLQTFRSDHLPHRSIPLNDSSLTTSYPSVKNKGLNMIKIIDVGQTAPSGKIIAASALSDNIFLALSSSGFAYYLVLNRPESQSSPLIDSLTAAQNSSMNNHHNEDGDINYSNLLVNNTTQSPPSSPSTMNSSFAQQQSNNATSSSPSSNSIIANVVSPFRAQSLSFDDDDSLMNNINSSILNLNSNSSVSDETNNNNNIGSFGSSVTRKSVGSDSGADENVFIKRSGSTHINPVSSFGSFESFGSNLSSFNSMSSLANSNDSFLTSNVSFGFTRGKIAWFTPGENSVRLIGDEKVINETNIFPELPFIACSCYETYFCSDACTVSVVKTGQNPYQICTTRTRISALVADEIFHVLVVGTMDGFIHIFRTIDGGLVKSIDLSLEEENNKKYEERFKEVRKILITSKWGLILVRIFGKIKVFNINGRHIIDIPLHENILKWFTYSDSKSFDFVVFENSEHKIGFFDPLKSDSVKYFYETMEPLPLISFIPSIGCFAFLSESKQITLVPHP